MNAIKIGSDIFDWKCEGGSSLLFVETDRSAILNSNGGNPITRFTFIKKLG